jgi:DNA polymerase III delta prime subunit
METKNNFPTIAISGPPGCGKTLLAALIAQTLENHGYVVTNKDDLAANILQEKLTNNHLNPCIRPRSEVHIYSCTELRTHFPSVQRAPTPEPELRVNQGELELGFPSTPPEEDAAAPIRSVRFLNLAQEYLVTLRQTIHHAINEEVLVGLLDSLDSAYLEGRRSVIGTPSESEDEK